MSGTRRRFPFDGSIFPFGAIHYSTLPQWQYYLQPIPEWRSWLERDLRRMNDIGLNTAAAHTDWNDREPAQDQLDFSRPDVLVELAEKVGLYTSLRPWPEFQPEWLPRVFPDGRWVADNGFTPRPSCGGHPRVREPAGNFIQKSGRTVPLQPGGLAVGRRRGTRPLDFGNEFDTRARRGSTWRRPSQAFEQKEGARGESILGAYLRGLL